MANDRCYLICKVCEARIMLAKHMAEDWYMVNVGQTWEPTPSGGYIETDPGTPTEVRVQRFIEEHGALLHGYAEDKDDRQPFCLGYEVTEWTPSINAGPNRQEGRDG